MAPSRLPATARPNRLTGIALRDPGFWSADELTASQQQYGYHHGRHRCLNQLGTTHQMYRDRGTQQRNRCYPGPLLTAPQAASHDQQPAPDSDPDNRNRGDGPEGRQVVL